MKAEIITGILAFSGAFIGAIFNRLTQHQTWLREKRSEAFSEFLRSLDIARTRATDVLIEFMGKGESAAMGVKLHGIYEPVLIQSKIVRLYLPENERDVFSQHVKEIYILHSSPHLGDARLYKLDGNIDKIQKIFEFALLGNKLNRWLNEKCNSVKWLFKSTKA